MRCIFPWRLRKRDFMKKITAIILLIICVFSFGSCKKEKDVLHLGINAEIIEIDNDNQIICVSDSGTENILGAKCKIDCKKLIERKDIIYVDYDTHELSIIKFSDLTVGDKIIINAYESQLKCVSDGKIEVKQIQLSTQRL